MLNEQNPFGFSGSASTRISLGGDVILRQEPDGDEDEEDGDDEDEEDGGNEDDNDDEDESDEGYSE